MDVLGAVRGSSTKACRPPSCWKIVAASVVALVDAASMRTPELRKDSSRRRLASDVVVELDVGEDRRRWA
jgi:hypothetical protein